MPVQIDVLLEPIAATAIPPEHTGPAVYSAFLAAVRATDPTLACALHDIPRFKPFAITPVLDPCGLPPCEPGVPARFSVTLLDERHAAVVLAALQVCQEYQIARTRYRSTGLNVRTQTYPELEALARADVLRWSFRLLTPVGFATARSDGSRRQRPWPEPERIFGNLARRWEAFAPDCPLPAATGTAIIDHLEAVAADVRIIRHLVEPRQRVEEHRYRRGVIGTVTYRVSEPDGVGVDVRRAIDTLAHFAEFAGMGDRTAMGMGHNRLLQPAAGGASVGGI